MNLLTLPRVFLLLIVFPAFVYASEHTSPLTPEQVTLVEAVIDFICETTGHTPEGQEISDRLATLLDNGQVRAIDDPDGDWGTWWGDLEILGLNFTVSADDFFFLVSVAIHETIHSLSPNPPPQSIGEIIAEEIRTLLIHEHILNIIIDYLLTLEPIPWDLIESIEDWLLLIQHLLQQYRQSVVDYNNSKKILVEKSGPTLQDILKQHRQELVCIQDFHRHCVGLVPAR